MLKFFFFFFFFMCIDILDSYVEEDWPSIGCDLANALMSMAGIYSKAPDINIVDLDIDADLEGGYISELEG